MKTIAWETFRARRADEHGPVWSARGVVGELPGLPARLLRVAGTVTGRPISNGLRERVMLAVAHENGCRYCMAAHALFGAASGIPQDEVTALLQGRWTSESPAERVALAYARDRTARSFASRDERLWEALEPHFTTAQKEAIEATARVMNFANRAGNTLDALLAHGSGRRARQGRTRVEASRLRSRWKALPDPPRPAGANPGEPAPSVGAGHHRTIVSSDGYEQPG